MKTLLILISILAATLTANAKHIRIECGAGGAPNPHGGDTDYYGVYRNSDMTTYRMLILPAEGESVERELDMNESRITPESNWPLMTAVISYGTKSTPIKKVMVIDKVVTLTPPTATYENWQFDAEGYMFSTDKAQVKLVCYGIFDPK